MKIPTKLVDIVKTLSGLAVGGAEYKELFDKAMATAREDEQEVLQRAYAEHKAKSDADHAQLQSDLKDAAKK